jgi:hypothetical protein
VLVLSFCNLQLAKISGLYLKMPGVMPLTTEEIAWMLSRPDDSLVPNIIACGTITLIAATLSIIMRLSSRKLVRRRLDLDASDWLVITAWVRTFKL